MIKPKGYFRATKYDYIDFEKDLGGNYIITSRTIELSCDETKQFFMAMYNAYCVANDKFWENQGVTPKGATKE